MGVGDLASVYFINKHVDTVCYKIVLSEDQQVVTFYTLKALQLFDKHPAVKETDHLKYRELLDDLPMNMHNEYRVKVG